MSYKVRIRSSMQKRIVAWNLPDPVFVEIFLRLEQGLKDKPAEKLVRMQQPFDGMTYDFTLVDPTNRFREFSFVFHLVYGQDEETLQVLNGGFSAWGL